MGEEELYVDSDDNLQVDQYDDMSIVHDEDLMVRPCNMRELIFGNLYKNVLACMTEGRRIELDRYEDLNNKLNDWIEYLDKFDQETTDIAAQDEISQFFENLKKPELVALDEFFDKKLVIEDISDDVSE